MRSAHLICIFTLQMQVFGIFFQSRLAKKFVSHRTSASRESSLVDPNEGSRIERLRRVASLGNVTQDNSNQPLSLSSQDSSKISSPTVNFAHKSSSANAKGFWNQFMFRGKSDFRYVLPIRNIREEKCRALSFSQRIFHDNCETLELQNNVCFGKCDPSPSSGEDVHCSVCSPVSVAHKTVKLQCVDNAEVIKVVKVIEDCQCEAKPGQHSHLSGPALVDPSVH